MLIEVDQLNPKQWEQVSEKAHLVVFNTTKPKDWDRIDFALIVRRGEDLMGYLTAREHDAHTLYLQYGGAFPGTRDSSLSFVAYKAMVDFCKDRYPRITTIVENNNFVYLKMAMKVGFKIVGVRVHQSSVLLEHLWEDSKDEV